MFTIATSTAVPASITPDQQYLSMLANTSVRPVFVVGAYRSGTTILHRFLFMTGCFNAVTPYHLLRYDELLTNYLTGRQLEAQQEISALFAERGLHDRIFDGVKVAPDAPVEYAYVLRKRGLLPRINPKSRARFWEFAKKLQFVSDPNKPLLLKNPMDAGNFLYIKQAVPNARFVFIHRHPLHVLNSQLKAARSVLASQNPFLSLMQEYRALFEHPARLKFLRLLVSDRLELGLRLLTPLMRRVTKYYVEHIGSLPSSDYVSIRYEDLCADPVGTMERVNSFLAMEPVQPIAYEQLIAPRPTQLLPEVGRHQYAIQQKLRPYYTYHCYGVE